MRNESENVITDRERVARAREAAGMTQRDLSEAMGVSQTYVALFESGKKAWPAERVEQALREISAYEAPSSPEKRARDLECMRAILDRFNAEGWPE